MTNGAGPRNHSKTSRFVGGLDEDFDLQVLRTLQGKTTVVPLISKAGHHHHGSYGIPQEDRFGEFKNGWT